MSWAKGSRFWTFGPLVVLAALWVTFHFNDPSTFTAIGTAFLAGAGAQSAIRHHHDGRARWSVGKAALREPHRTPEDIEP